MAARTVKIRHDEETRAKIQTSQLINRLTGHALGDVELSSTQVRAIEVLLKKTIPDLANIQHSGDAENPVAMITELRRTIIDAKPGDSNGSGVPPAT